MVLFVVTLGAMWTVAPGHGASLHQRRAPPARGGRGIAEMSLPSSGTSASELFACIVLLSLIGFVSNALLAIVEKRRLRWQQA